MKIEISKSAPITPDFPAFYTDNTGDLWLWVDRTTACCISNPTVFEHDDYFEVDFDEFNTRWEFVKVHGIITITQE